MISASFPNPSLTPALSSRPSSTYGAPRQAMDVATATSYSSPPSSLTTDCPGIDDCSGRSSQISRPVTPMNAVNLNPTPQPSAQGLVSRSPTHPPHLPDSLDSTQSQHLPCSPAIPSQQSSVFERQMVSLLLIFNPRMIMLKHSKPSPDKELPPPQHRSQEIFNNAHHFTMTGPSLIESNQGNSKKYALCAIVCQF
jgi:hypothetical protein